MKKLFALILAGALAAGTLTACGSTAVVAVPQPEESAPPAGEPTQVSTPENSGAAVKTGYYLGTDISGSKSAAAEEEGVAQANLELVAVTVTDEGVIDDCVIDAIQSKINFDATGAITTDLTAPALSKTSWAATTAWSRPVPSARNGTSRSRRWPTMWKARPWTRSAALP